MLLIRPLTLRLVFVLLFLSLIPATTGPCTSWAADNAFSSPLERRYQAAKDYYYRLRRDETIQGNRLNWVKGTRLFRAIYLENPRSELAPNCLFMLGTMHYRMFLRFDFQEDLDEAVTYYSDVWQLFPNSSLADDALYWTAEIHRKHRNDTEHAAQLFARQLKRYPDGDKYAQALNRYRELVPDLSSPAAKKLDLPGNGSGLNHVLPVQYWSSDDYSRIVIRSSGPVTYTSKLVKKKDEERWQLLIDFPHSTIEQQYTAPVVVREGLLQRIKSDRLNDSRVRITLDVASISTYKVFSLNDPFRVIVDVHGQQKVLASSKSVPLLRPERVTRQSSARTDKKGQRGDGDKPRRHPVAPKKVDTTHDQDLETEPFPVLSETSKRKPASTGEKAGQNDTGLSLAQQLGLGIRRIVIDPGHGGKDPGAMGNGLKEKDITLQVAKKTAEVLRSRYGYEVLLTRNEDRYLPLEERTAIANTRKADLFVSIHVNAHPDKKTRGVETFYLNLATNSEAMRVAALENATSTLNMSDLQDVLTDLMQNSKIQESSVLAEFVQNRMVEGLAENRFPAKDLGVKQAPFYVLIGAEMPAILAEISFISNKEDARRLRQDDFLAAVAEQLAAGVAGYANHQATAALRL
ncbi:MAG: N-acetylmuramoyl-L-alanine amidase [Desulfobulbaceae bacterium]